MHLTRTIEQYKSKKALWDRIVEAFLELPASDRQDVIAKLILLEDEHAAPPARAPAESGVFEVSARHAHADDHPRLADIVVDVLKSAGEPLTQAQIFKSAKAVQPKVKQASIETTTSKLAKKHTSIVYAGLDRQGRKLYTLAS